MKPCNLLVKLIVLLILAAASMEPASASLQTLLAAGPFHRQWEPVSPDGWSSHSITLQPGITAQIYIPACSGLRIESLSPTDSVQVFSNTLSGAGGAPCSQVPVSPARAPDGALLFPTGMISGTIFDLSATETIEIRLSRHASSARPYFWESLCRETLQELDDGTLRQAVFTLSDAAESDGDFSLTGIWIRMIRSAADISETRRNPDGDFRSAIQRITGMFGILAGEDTCDEPFEALYPTVDIPATDRVGGSTGYHALPAGDDIAVSGPAWLMLSMRVPWATRPAASMNELPFDLLIDGKSSGFWPDHTCRFFTDPAVPGYSAAVDLNVFVPAGQHRLGFHSETPVLLQGSVRRPIFGEAETGADWFSTNPMDQIPAHRFRDAGWLDGQFRSGGSNPVLQWIAVHYGNRFVWNPVPTDAEPQCFIEPLSRPHQQPADLPPATDGRPGQGLYRIPDGSSFQFLTAAYSDSPPEIVTLIDPDRTPENPPPVIRLDGKVITLPDLSDPFTVPGTIALPVASGNTVFSFEMHGRRMFSDKPIGEIEAEPLEYRRYYHGGTATASPGAAFKVNGLQSGAPVRIHYHRPAGKLFELHLDGVPWRTVIPSIPGTSAGNEHPSAEPQAPGIALLSVPPGEHILTAVTDEPLMMAVSQPGWIRDREETLIRRDASLETAVDAIGTWTREEAVTQLKEIGPGATFDRALRLTLAGDPVRARDILFESGYDEMTGSHRLLLAWILADTGYAFRAVDTFIPLVEQKIVPYSGRIFHRMLDMALSTGALRHALTIAGEIHRRNDDSAASRTLREGAAAFIDHGTGVFERTLFSLDPRWRPVPSDRIRSEAQRVRLMDNWFSTGDSESGSSDSADYWLVESGKPLEFDLPEQAVLRLLVRPPDAFTPDAAPAGRRAMLRIEHPSFNAELPVPAGSADRESLSWDSVASAPGRPFEYILPVPEAGTVTIRCQELRLPVKPMVQIVATADLLNVPRATDTAQTDGDSHPPETSTGAIIRRYLDILQAGPAAVSGCGSMDPALAYAQITLMQSDHPDFFPARSMGQLLEQCIDWKLAGGWPQTTRERAYLAARRITCDDLVNLRGMEVPEPAGTLQSHLLTSGRRIAFDTAELSGGTLEFTVAAADPADYTIWIEQENHGIASLTPETRVCSMDFSPGSTDRIAVRAESIRGPRPVRIAATHCRNGERKAVPLSGNRRYHVIQPRHSAGVSGEIIGPACLRLEMRNAWPDGGAQSIQVSLTDSVKKPVWQSAVDLPAIPDPDVYDALTGQASGTATEIIVPVVARGVHNLTVSPRDPAGSPALVRCYALHPKADPIELIPPDRQPHSDESAEIPAPDGSGLPAEAPEQPEETMTPGSTAWSYQMPHADGTLKTAARTGTWTIGMNYRHRDFNPDPETDESTAYSGDGPGAFATWERRFDAVGTRKRRSDPVGNRHRLFVDGTLGATHSADEPSGVTGYLTHNANWLLPVNGTRVTWGLQGAFQEIDDSTVWRLRFQGDLRRSFDLTPAITLTGSAGAFVTAQSLDADDVVAMDDRPPPVLYTDFDARHESGGWLRLYVAARPHARIRVHGYWKVMTSGDDETGLFGPWRAGAGVDAMTGPVLLGLAYEERQTFGDSPDPDRSRLEASISAMHWQNGNSLWEFRVFHRYTPDEDWNDTGLTVSLRFDGNRLLRDADPFRTLFKDRIAALMDWE